MFISAVSLFCFPQFDNPPAELGMNVPITTPVNGAAGGALRYNAWKYTSLLLGRYSQRRQSRS